MWACVLDETKHLQTYMHIEDENVASWGGPEGFSVMMLFEEPKLDPRFDQGQHVWNDSLKEFIVDPDEYAKWAEENPELAAQDKQVLVNVVTGEIVNE